MSSSKMFPFLWGEEATAAVRDDGDDDHVSSCDNFFVQPPSFRQCHSKAMWRRQHRRTSGRGRSNDPNHDDHVNDNLSQQPPTFYLHETQDDVIEITHHNDLPLGLQMHHRPHTDVWILQSRWYYGIPLMVVVRQQSPQTSSKSSPLNHWGKRFCSTNYTLYTTQPNYPGQFPVTTAADEDDTAKATGTTNKIAAKFPCRLYVWGAVEQGFTQQVVWRHVGPAATAEAKDTTDEQRTKYYTIDTKGNVYGTTTVATTTDTPAEAPPFTRRVLVAHFHNARALTVAPFYATTTTGTPHRNTTTMDSPGLLLCLCAICGSNHSHNHTEDESRQDG